MTVWFGDKSWVKSSWIAFLWNGQQPGESIDARAQTVNDSKV